MSVTQEADSVYALLADGTTIEIRPAAPADFEAVKAMYEVTDLDLNPVIARPDGVFAVDARVKVGPYQSQDPFLRKLR